jgi:hypothetical protein
VFHEVAASTWGKVPDKEYRNSFRCSSFFRRIFINPYLGLGDYDQAFAWFERAYQEQSNILHFLKVHPFFHPVREDPGSTT